MHKNDVVYIIKNIYVKLLTLKVYYESYVKNHN